MAKKRKPSKRITTKHVQATENLPAPAVPQVDAKPEIDEDPWDAEGLTLKQRRFCEAYVGPAAGNATRAAQMAGYRDDNRHSLEATASENLRKPALRSFIGRLIARQGVGVEYLKSRLAQLAQSSLDNCCTIDRDGEVVVDMKMAAELGALGQIKELSDEILKTGGECSTIRRKVKLHDPTKAIELLLRMHGAIIDRHEHSGSIEHKHAVQPAMEKILGDPKNLAHARALRASMNGSNGAASHNGNGNGKH